MKKSILLTVLSLILLVTSVVSAGPRQEIKNDISDIKRSQLEINSTIVSFNNLSIAIDLWHDASLKGNRKAASEHEQIIFEIILEDIKSNSKSITYAKLETSYAKDEFKQNKNRNQKADDRQDFRDDKRDLKNAEAILNTKQLLFSSLKNSKSFAFSYRLIADYQHLLKQEIDVNKVELAEDVSELKEDAGKVRHLK